MNYIEDYEDGRLQIIEDAEIQGWYMLNNLDYLYENANVVVSWRNGKWYTHEKEKKSRQKN